VCTVTVICVFQCGTCEEIFPDAAQLRKHVRRTHSSGTPEKSFMCAECGQMFTRLGHLRRHARLHSGDKPFMCNRCACQFARADHLRRHLQAHHADELAQRPKDPDALDIKTELDSIPASSEFPLFGAPLGTCPSDVNLPVFPEPRIEDSDTRSPRDVDPLPPAASNMSGFSISSGSDDAGTAESLAVIPSRGVEKPTSAAASHVSSEVAHAQLDGGKSVTSKDRSSTSTAAAFEPATVAGPVLGFPGRAREEKSGTQYPLVEIPGKNPQLDGRKSTGSDDCDHSSSRFPESGTTSALSPADHRNFPVSGDPTAAFRADFWHRTSPAYVNDRLFLAGAANLRHFDAGFSRSPEPNLAHHYNQSHSMMAGNFFGGVVDFRRLQPENPAVTSQPMDTNARDASPLSLARYQRK